MWPAVALVESGIKAGAKISAASRQGEYEVRGEHGRNATPWPHGSPCLSASAYHAIGRCQGIFPPEEGAFRSQTRCHVLRPDRLVVEAKLSVGWDQKPPGGMVRGSGGRCVGRDRRRWWAGCV